MLTLTSGTATEACKAGDQLVVENAEVWGRIRAMRGTISTDDCGRLGGAVELVTVST